MTTTEPQLDFARLLHEFKHALAGLEAMAGELSKSDDMDEIRLVVSEIDQMHVELRRVSSAVYLRLYWLERWDRDFHGVTGGPDSNGYAGWSG